jgi:hypothetical protein
MNHPTPDMMRQRKIFRLFLLTLMRLELATGNDFALVWIELRDYNG